MNDNQMKYVVNLIIQLEKIENKYNQLQSNWNSLREWLEDLGLADVYAREVLDKMNELEGKDKE